MDSKKKRAFSNSQRYSLNKKGTVNTTNVNNSKVDTNREADSVAVQCDHNLDFTQPLSVQLPYRKEKMVLPWGNFQAFSKKILSTHVEF